MHGAARLGDTGGQGVTHPVPARERRKQGRVGVHDPIGKGLVDGTRQHGAEARHGHQIDLVGHQRGRHRAREGVPVELRTEAAIGVPVHQLRRDPVLLGQPEGRAGPVGEDDTDRQAIRDHRLQNRPGTRDENREAHALNLTAAPTNVYTLHQVAIDVAASLVGPGRGQAERDSTRDRRR